MREGNFTRRQVLTAGVAMGVAAPVLAQSDAPIRLVVTFPPGGSTDITARIIQPELARRTGRNVIVEKIGRAHV